MGMYSDIRKGVSENIEIMGIPFHAEEINGDESFNRREYNHNSIQNGTEVVTKGKYIPRKFTFTTTIYHKKNRPYEYDKIIQKIMSEPVEVISPYMGGRFRAIVVIQKNIPECSPNHMSLDVEITEVPYIKSRIPGENFVVPAPKKIEIKSK